MAALIIQLVEKLFWMPCDVFKYSKENIKLGQVENVQLKSLSIFTPKKECQFSIMLFWTSDMEGQ